MTLSTTQITELSKRVAAQVSPRLKVLGVTAADGGSERIELLVELLGCHDDPCHVMLNLSRADVQSLDEQLRTKLHAVFTDHMQSPQP